MAPGTNFRTGLSVFGAPVMPFTTGNVFYVKASGGSDGNDGRSVDQAFATLVYALTQCVASQGDVIVMLPGSHSYSTTHALSKAGVTITGLPGGNPQRRPTSIVSSVADELMTVSAANVTISDLHIIVTTAQGGIEFGNSATSLAILNCSFDMFTAAASTSTIGLQSIGTAGGVKNLYVENCYFESLDAQGPYADLNDCSYATFRNVTTRHTGATALADAFVSATGAVDVLFDHVRIIAGTGAVITDGFDWTGNTIDGSLQLLDVRMSLSVGTVNGSADADAWVWSDSEINQTAAGGSAFLNVLNAG